MANGQGRELFNVQTQAPDDFAFLRGFLPQFSQGLQNQQTGRQLGQLGQQLPQGNILREALLGRNITNPLVQQIVGNALTQQLSAQPAGGPAGFTLSPGQERFTAGGAPVAAVPSTPPARAGGLQISRIGDNSGFPPGTVTQQDPQGNVRVISQPGGEGLSGADKTKLAVSEGKDFRADPRIKNLQIIERSEKGMRAALKQATSPNVKSRIASDQALGVLFQKMLDPESVVRESEFARTPEGAAAVNRLLAIGPQLKLGGLKLLDEDRRALVTMAQTLLDGAKESANQAFSEFGTRAGEIGLNQRIIFGGAKPFDIPVEAGSNPALDSIDAQIAEIEAALRAQ